MQETTARIKEPGIGRYTEALLATVCGLAFSGCAPGVPAEADYTIAFTSFAPLNQDLFIADADGSHVKPFLAHPDQDYNASFSRDGTWIVFTSERDGSADIYRAHADGSGLEKLVGDRAFDDQAALSPDGRYLAFVSTRAGHANIWRLDLETKGGRLRHVPLTVRLATALRKHRHLRVRRVLHRDDLDRSPLTQKIVQDWVRRAARRARVAEGVHVLRHHADSRIMPTRCSARGVFPLTDCALFVVRSA